MRGQPTAGTAGANSNPPPSVGAGQGEGEPDLRAALAEGLSRARGRPVGIAGVESRPLDDCSTHPIHRLRVRLSTGEDVPVIFKQPAARPDRPRAGREVLTYRRLLAGCRFGAPQLYASVHNEAAGRFWLLLEDVGTQPLKHRPREDWLAAVGCLARLHAAYLGRADELRALGCLGEHGPEHDHRLAGSARRNLELAANRADLARFDRLMGGYDRLVGRLVQEPRALVHGDIFSRNILLQPGPRVRLIDWESAAVGLPAWDLARLLDGWGKDTPPFLAAYLDECARHTAEALDREAFAAAFRLCAVPVALLHLAWSADGCREEAGRAELLARLETAWELARKEGVDG